MVIIVLGALRRATRRLVLALGILGALIPAVALLYLIPAVAFGDPVAVQPFGAGSGFGAWIAPSYRIDTFALYTALGVAFLAVPLLLWLAFADRAGSEAGEADEKDGAAEEEVTEDSDASEETDEDAGLAPAGPEAPRVPAWLGGAQGLAAPALVRGVAFILALEMLALTAALADSVVLLGVSWVLLALAAWATGEATSDRAHLDLPGLGVMLAGPVLWLIIVLFPAAGAHTPRLFSLTGATAFNTFQVILLAVAIALAGGAYPFTAWLRRRAALATPAGIGAVVVVLVPAALYIAVRLYGAAASTASNLWPLFGATSTTPSTPAPVTAGIAFALLGTATVAISGLLALPRRDARTLIALLAAAQFGWGLVGVGIGEPVSVLGTIILLPALLLGLGAMLAALTANGVITSDLEPDADGPRPVDTPPRPLALAAWGVGALSLIGVPLLAGFAPRQLMNVGAIQINGLGIPLLGLCWMGDLLLALALLRAAAPAFATPAGETRTLAYGWHDLPAAILAVPALAVGIFPALLTGAFGNAAAEAVVGPRAARGLVASSGLGYTAGAAQWLAALAWLTLAVVAAVLLLARAGVARAAKPAFAVAPGATDEDEAEGEATADVEASVNEPLPVTASAADAPLDETEPEMTLAAPREVWSDLRSTLTSPWLLPAGGWLLAGTDDDAGETLDAEDDDAADADDADHDSEDDAAGDEPYDDGDDAGAQEEEPESASDAPIPTKPAKPAKRGAAPRNPQ